MGLSKFIERLNEIRDVTPFDPLVWVRSPAQIGGKFLIADIKEIELEDLGSMNVRTGEVGKAPAILID